MISNAEPKEPRRAPAGEVVKDTQTHTYKEKGTAEHRQREAGFVVQEFKEKYTYSVRCKAMNVYGSEMPFSFPGEPAMLFFCTKRVFWAPMMISPLIIVFLSCC